MKIYEHLEDVQEMRPCFLALGNFDGVHVGHQKLIAEAVKKARQAGGVCGVLTFSNHPKTLFNPDAPVRNIIYPEEKCALIESLGVDYLFNPAFTWEIAKMEPLTFIDEILVKRLHAREVFCGFNYRFGCHAAGDVALLREAGHEKGFGVTEIPPITVDGDVVSSTLIRSLIGAGDMEACQKFLGRRYSIAGEVVVGNRLGRTIGFPTSNIMIDESMVSPPNGVYVTVCTYNGVRYPSVTNVGVKPTIGAFHKNVETHIFNFDKILYGKQIRVEFLKKTRDEVKFDSVDALAAQIVKDCQEAKAYHGLRDL